MIFEIISLFPDFFHSALTTSLLGKAVTDGLVTVHVTDPRDFATDKHRSVDDTPYGGGAGMVLRAEPIVRALEHITGKRGPAHRVALRPQGRTLVQADLNRLIKYPRIVLLCGRYEGFDERIFGEIDEEISLGDFVLSGGEPAALVVIDAMVRKLPGVMGNSESLTDESFEQGLLEYPQYTKPQVFHERAVPEVLMSGNHEQIRRWRKLQSLLWTRARRPDLYANYPFTDEDLALLAEHARGAK